MPDSNGHDTRTGDAIRPQGRLRGARQSRRAV